MPAKSTRRPAKQSASSKSKAQRPASSRAKATSSRARSQKTAPQKAPAPRWRWQDIPLDRRLDIVGVVLTLLGLLSLLSLFSSQHGTLTGWWVNILSKTAGWGAFALPIALIGIGLWLVFRNLESLPAFSAARLVGILSLYWNLLSWLHLLAGGGFGLAAAGGGGGYAGALFERLLVTSVGRAGAAIGLTAWLLISLAFALDRSLPELFHRARAWAESRLEHPAATTTRPVPSASSPANRHEPAPTGSLPGSFKPISTQSISRPSSAAPATSGVNPTPAVPPAAPSTAAQAPAEPAAATPPPPSTTWVLPAIDAILDPPTKVAIQANLDQDRAHLIEETLASFGAPGHVVEIHRGPTVTQFGVEPDFMETRSGRTRVRVSKITGLADDLALALAAPRIRIQAPVPGRNYVGIEVPNQEISRVTLREVLDSEVFKKIYSRLRFALGKDVSGKPVAADLTSMPHLLIAGTTGSGKSVCVNAILCGLLLNNTPTDLRLVLVDPKRVELTGYNGIPHLLAPVVVDTERVVGALQWMQREMDSRYHKFSQAGVRNISEFNHRYPEQHLPYLIVLIDELADLMMLAPDETERSITRLAQLARATGIHLILATQRPSVDVVTGLIKANFPARIAFAVASGVDSRVILDQPGAERLLGRGDMLFQAPDASAPVRLQGVYVSESELQRLINYWRLAAEAQASAQPATDAAEALEIETLPSGLPLRQAPLWEQIEQDADPLLQEAIELVRREGRASITMLQRRLRIGYTRAARLVDAMEERKIISPALPNSSAREVLDYGQGAPPPED